MTVMWTACSFNQFLLSAQMKYFEGNIFVNFYIFGAAGVIAVIIGGFLYTKLGVRNTYVLSFYLSIVGALGVIMVQMNLMGYK